MQQSGDWIEAAERAHSLYNDVVTAKIEICEAETRLREAQQHYDTALHQYQQAEATSHRMFWSDWMEAWQRGNSPVRTPEAQGTVLPVRIVSEDGQVLWSAAKRRQEQAGQGMIEYALILTLMALVVLVVLMWFGPALGNIFSNITAGL